MTKTDSATNAHELAARLAAYPTHEELESLQAEASEEALERRIAAYQVAHRFPLRAFEAAVVAKPTVPAIVRMSEWHARGTAGIAVLAGAIGCGKTVAVTWWALQRRRAPAYIIANKLARLPHCDLAQWCVPALVIDDVGVEFDARGSFHADLSDLVDTFCANRWTLVITTNYTAEEFRGRYERVHDRLREAGTWLTASGPSLRGGYIP